LGIGDWGLGPIPNPQSPIPKKSVSLIDVYPNLNLISNLKSLYKFIIIPFCLKQKIK